MRWEIGDVQSFGVGAKQRVLRDSSRQRVEIHLGATLQLSRGKTPARAQLLQPERDPSSRSALHYPWMHVPILHALRRIMR